MGTTILNALKSVLYFLIFVIISMLTIVFLLAMDIVAIIAYPVYAWRHPDKAAGEHSLVSILGWKTLIDIVNPGNSYYGDNIIVEWAQAVMRPIDAAVPTLWNWVFLKFAPMKKRKYFIDLLGNRLQDLSEKTQCKYFAHCDFERRVYLIKHNMLSEEAQLFRYYNDEFVAAGRVKDIEFSSLTLDDIRKFAENFDLSVQKQKDLVRWCMNKRVNGEYCKILCDYILRKGLHPSAVSYLYKQMEDCEAETKATLLEAIRCRQDLVVVRTTKDLQVFASYLEDKKGDSVGPVLSHKAQAEMTSGQYKIFHKVGGKLSPEAIHAKLAGVNKSEDTIRCAALMMCYGEVGDEEAMAQIAVSEQLTEMWVKHLSTNYDE